jgi:hypothetical protein
MSEVIPPGFFAFGVRFYGNDRAEIFFITTPKSKKIKVKFATAAEPKKLYELEEFNRIVSTHTYLKGEILKFYVVNEEENKRELAKLQIKWSDAPSYSDTVKHIVHTSDLTDIIEKIGG